MPRCWAAHQTITDPVHAAAAADLRRARRLAAVPAIQATVEQRSLADYDRLFGLASEGTAFATAAQWVARLADAHHAGRLQDELTKLGRVPLLIVDLCRHRDYAEDPRPRLSLA